MTKPGGLSFERVLVDRETAEKLLGANVHNRHLRQRRVSTYAYDMLKGHWLETGDTIKVSTTGALLDGQHRLAAVVQAATDGVVVPGEDDLEADPDIQIPFIVVRGVADKAQAAMDINAVRRLSDVLTLQRGEKNSVTMAAVLRIIYAWESGFRRQIAKQGLATNAALIEFYDSDPELFRGLVQTAGQLRKIDLPPSVLALALYLLENADANENKDAEYFFARLNDGQNLAKGDPIYELREALKRVKAERGHRAVAYTLALTIKAWNSYRLGEKIGVLTFKMGGRHPETFPVPL